jgi:ketosteroid isomerase-like protein
MKRAPGSAQPWVSFEREGAMSTANETLVDSASLKALQDRTDIADVLYRYSSAVDSFDRDGIRSALADDIWAQYGNGDPVTGADALADWITQATATCIWQHHLLNVYHVTIDGDEAKTLSYLTSYQVFEEDPNAAIILVARYHDELKRTSDGWKISKRIMELLWGESKADEGYLAGLGGRGPKIWQRS